MDRINSSNARTDVNGAGKRGFHDNADLAGQDATYLTPDWCNHIQEEIAGVIEVNEPLNPLKKDQLKTALFSLFATNLSLEEVDSRLSAAIVSLASAMQPFLVKTGTIELWTNTVCPNDYLECNGQAVSRTVYSSLFTLIGTTFGAGNGTTTFNIPDLRGEFVRGWDHARGIDSGRTLGSHQEATSVFMGDPNQSQGRIANLYNNFDDDSDTLRTALKGEGTTVDQTNVILLSSPAELPDVVTPIQSTMSVRPRNIALMFIIKT